MPSVDTVKEWFLKKVLLPRAFVINTPGFITGRYFERMGFGHFSRHVFLPEDILSDLESSLIERLGEHGKKILYSSAKICTWRFCKMMGIPPFNQKNLKNDAKLLFTFLGTMYAKSLKIAVDEENEAVNLIVDDIAVAGKRAKGYFVPIGTLAGLWSYGFQKKEIEAVSIGCNEKNNKKCKFKAGVPRKLTGEIITFDSFHEFEKGQGYDIMNKAVALTGPSLKELINKYFFKYQSGTLEIWGKRFFPFEIGYIYKLEEELKQINCEDVIFDVSFSFYKKLTSQNRMENRLKFTASFLKALGWGKLTIIPGKKLKVVCECYPWTNLYSKKSQFPFFRGALSGMLSAYFGKELKFKMKDSKLLNNLSLSFET